MPNKLNLFIIGAAKAGTTTLWEVLRQQPGVCMGQVKEPCIFSFSDWEERERDILPTYDPGAEWRGEASSIYSDTLTLPDIAIKLYHYNPDARILYVVRHPVDRIYSVWKQALFTGHHHRRAYETYTDLAEVPPMPASLSKAVWTYPPFMGGCKYYTHYSSYTSVFPREQICLLFYEDLKHNPKSFYHQIETFLSIPPIPEKETGVWENVGGGRRIKSSPFWSSLSRRLGVEGFLHSHPKVHYSLSRLLHPGIDPNARLRPEEEEKILACLAEDMSNTLRAGGKPAEYWGPRPAIEPSGENT